MATKKNAAKPAAKKDNSKKPAPAKPLDEREVLKKKIADGEEAVEQLEKALKDKQKELAKDKASRKNAVKLFERKLQKEVQRILGLVANNETGRIAKAVEKVVLRERCSNARTEFCGEKFDYSCLYLYTSAFGRVEYDEERKEYANKRSYSREAVLECEDDSTREKLEKTIVGDGVVIYSPYVGDSNFTILATILAYYYLMNKDIDQAIQKTKALIEQREKKHIVFGGYDVLVEYLYDHS